MKQIYTRENRYLVHNIQNLVEYNGIATRLKNEFAAGAAGDLVPHEAWLELWVLHDSDYAHAMKIIDNVTNTKIHTDWICSQCNEVNTASFDFCWKCQRSHE